jgi:hypothetical protein
MEIEIHVRVKFRINLLFRKVDVYNLDQRTTVKVFDATTDMTALLKRLIKNVGIETQVFDIRGTYAGYTILLEEPDAAGKTQ